MEILPFGGSDKRAKRYEAFEIDRSQHVPLRALSGELLEIRPYRDNDGIAAGANLLQSLHDVRVRGGENVSDAHAFEIWFDRGEFSFKLYAANSRASERFQKRTTNTYTNSEVIPLQSGEAFPELRAGDHVAGAFLTLEDHTFLPIRHRNAEGFDHGDPYSDIMGEMLTLDDSLVVVQAVFKPADKSWTSDGPNGESVGDVAEGLRSGEVEGFWDLWWWLGFRDLEIRDSSSKDKQAADIVEDQRGEQGFHVNVRILAASPDPREAIERARGVGSMYAKFYNAKTEQGLDHNPVKADEDTMKGMVSDMIERRFIDREMILSIDELAGVAHIPNKDIEVPQIPWKTTQTGSQIAAEAAKDEPSSARDRTTSRAEPDDRKEWPSDDGGW